MSPRVEVVSGRVPTVRSVRRHLARVPRLLRQLPAAFSEHSLMTYAAALAFQAIVALIPLTLLGLGLLGALGLRDVWTDTVAPAIRGNVTEPVFEAIDFSVNRVLSSGTAGLIVFAFLLVLWYLTFAVRASMEALNRIHDVEERRSLARRLLIAVGLAVALGVCFVGAVLAVSIAPRLVDGGAFDVLLTVGRWFVAAGLLGLAVGLLMRYAPAEQPQARWASAGSLLVIAVWIGASLVFQWWVSSVANFKTAIGSLTVFLVLTAYVFVSAAIFLVGAELDELLRKESGAPNRR